MTKTTNKWVRPILHELRYESCGFQHSTPDDFVKSQWQTRTKSRLYLIYRWCVAILFTVVVIISMLPAPEDKTSYWLYFIYLTNWGIWLCMLTNLLAAYLVTMWHYYPNYADKLLSDNTVTSPFRVYWAMHIITLNLSVVITIMYWSVLYNPTVHKLDATNILTHGLNAVCMLLDMLIIAHPLRLLHMLLPMSFGLVYALFSFIFQICGGINKEDKPYIYHVIDWRNPVQAVAVIFATQLLSCFVYGLLFMIYKLRLVLFNRLSSVRKSKSATAIANSNAVGTTLDNKANSAAAPAQLETTVTYENHGFCITNEKAKN